MANSINTKYSTELTFGSTNPVVSGTESDNDTYIVTSNGLSSGTPISCWKFDGETSTWVTTTIPDASTTVSGKVNTTTQSFAGPKTFIDNTTFGDTPTDTTTVNGTASFKNAIVQTPLVLGNFTVGGAVTPAANLAIYSFITIAQTTPNISMVLPAMAATDINKIVFVENRGTVNLLMNLTSYLLPNTGMLFRWNGLNWVKYNDYNYIPLIATATASIPLGFQNVIAQNGATNITLTLPNPANHVGHRVYFSRDPGSTGTVTITNSGTARIQALNGTVGTTTSIAALGANETWNAGFIATNTSLGYAWLRFS